MNENEATIHCTVEPDGKGDNTCTSEIHGNPGAVLYCICECLHALKEETDMDLVDFLSWVKTSFLVVGLKHKVDKLKKEMKDNG